MRHRLLAPLVGAALVAVPTSVAFAQDTPNPEPPSVAQLCAATGIDTIDAYLAALAESQLVDDLSPLIDLTVPRDNDGVEVEADVSLEQIRDALDCSAEDDDPDPTEEPEPSDDPDEDEDEPTTTPRRAPTPSIVDSDLPVTG